MSKWLNDMMKTQLDLESGRLDLSDRIKAREAYFEKVNAEVREQRRAEGKLRISGTIEPQDIGELFNVPLVKTK